ncbi:Guanyl-specific ribonuclease Sa [Corynebacterium occultum]|uniref:Guanyl-specific ribonuclease Sa n=1 Tax=Corynebacterium occultum TaxID=2675219 RepID=A0A6B8W5R1_9CORY|nr:ribonuclease domain-containing protein [Corynebacterium occultum]QGU07911.1 Guanyl-specific ribonuclease Sa [Corynebacterium occultum]
MAKQNSRKTGWTLGSVVALIIAVGAAWFGLGPENQSNENTSAAAPSSAAESTATPDTSQGSCALATLPREAAEVVETIQVGGPFDYPDNDGVHFGNYEGYLPQEHSNFYREYTVDTPGLNHRGPRRIVTGGGTDIDPETWYYTADHYESFCEIPDAE